MFDLFSSEYGWTSVEIRKMTIRELVARIKAINVRKKENYKFQAKLAGFSLDGEPEVGPENDVPLRKLGPSEEAKLKAHLDKRFAQKQKEMESLV